MAAKDTKGQFAVFGMTESYAREQAHKSLRPGSFTLADYEENVASLTQARMEDKKAVSQVSPRFGILEAAEEWLELAKKAGGVRLVIKINHPKKLVTKDGVDKPQNGWSIYREGKDYSLSAKGHVYNSPGAY